jgi:hypothetical protein
MPMSCLRRIGLSFALKFSAMRENGEKVASLGKTLIREWHSQEPIDKRVVGSGQDEDRPGELIDPVPRAFEAFLESLAEVGSGGQKRGKG